MKFDKVSEFLIDLLFPKHCVSCDKEGSFLCHDCKNKIIKIKTPFCPICNRITKDGKYCSRCKKEAHLNGVIIATHYQSIIKKVIADYKYEGIKGLDNSLSDLLLSAFENTTLFTKQIILIPVPIHRSRFNQRGYNQSELLCKKIVNKIPHASLNSKIIIKNKNTSHQVSLTRKQRLNNVKGSFSIKTKNQDISEKIIILVDDVYTTGATLNECAKILKPFYPKQIWGLVLAKH